MRVDFYAIVLCISANSNDDFSKVFDKQILVWNFFTIRNRNRINLTLGTYNNICLLIIYITFVMNKMMYTLFSLFLRVSCHSFMFVTCMYVRYIHVCMYICMYV